ncbi:MAG: cytidine deaminase [Myxococcales bacterium]|nr:cytidine deaminase [Myxococcales bacterium]
MSSPASSDDKLIALAKEAREKAYAPYSNYNVGCALTTEDGSVFTGANVENASYGLCICAERTAIATAVSQGHRKLQTVVVVTQSSPPAAPCGMCRQTLNEFCSEPSKLRILLVNVDGEEREFALDDLLPHGFRGEHIT